MVSWMGMAFEGQPTKLEHGKFLINQGYDQVSTATLKRALSELDRACREHADDPWTHYFVALANYRMVNVLNILNRRDTRQNLKYINQGIKSLNRALELDPGFTEAHILLGNLYGRKIGLRPLYALSLIPKMGKALEEARIAEPLNPRLKLIQAIFDFHTPFKFGGDKEQALKGFEDAARLFESATVQEAQWGQLDALAWLGMAHLERNDVDRARASFEYALKLYPRSVWVRDYLMPMVNTHASMR